MSFFKKILGFIGLDYSQQGLYGIPEGDKAEMTWIGHTYIETDLKDSAIEMAAGLKTVAVQAIISGTSQKRLVVKLESDTIIYESGQLPELSELERNYQNKLRGPNGMEQGAVISLKSANQSDLELVIPQS
jgi:hypothetical protein